MISNAFDQMQMWIYNILHDFRLINDEIGRHICYRLYWTVQLINELYNCANTFTSPGGTFVFCPFRFRLCLYESTYYQGVTIFARFKSKWQKVSEWHFFLQRVLHFSWSYLKVVAKMSTRAGKRIGTTIKRHFLFTFCTVKRNCFRFLDCHQTTGLTGMRFIWVKLLSRSMIPDFSNLDPPKWPHKQSGNPHSHNNKYLYFQAKQKIFFSFCFYIV